MAKPRLIQPRFDTPSPDATDQTTPHPLPDGLVGDPLRRLVVCAAVGAGLWTYGLAMEALVRPLTVAAPVMPSILGLEIFAIAASVLMLVYVRYAPGSLARKTDVGLVYFVLNAAIVAVFNTWTQLPASSDGRGLSWNTVVILVAAMILPVTPGRMLVASTIAAATDPLAAWIEYLRGAPIAPFGNILVLYMPNVACAVVAALPSHVLQRIGRRLRRAQEMGSYELVELLGRGGMGEVWRARHRLLARDAAIKLVRPELLGAGYGADAERTLRRFEQEAQATAALSSPHTIRLFDFGVTADDTFYYVMELLAGRDLKSLVREFGPVPAARAVFLLRQVCHSLAEAHARGLVHRDVTPSNIYLCRMGLDYDFVKVLDFGLVKVDQRQTPVSLSTVPPQTTGTPAFMAPELVLGAEVEPRADVYAIGCVAYYLLTGQPVFDADNPTDMFLLHLHAAPVPPSQRTELPVPRELDALVLACLDKDPRRRPQDAAAVLRLLARCPSRDIWDQQAAKTWWERHLVDLSGPLVANPHRSSNPLPSPSRPVLAGASLPSNAALRGYDPVDALTGEETRHAWT
jgi:serine/threonine-protein kinase